MRIRFRNADLLPAAAVAQSVANAQSTLPILANVLLNSEHDNVVTVIATDFETRVRIEVAAEVEKRGTVTIPARTLHDLVKEIPDGHEVLMTAAKDIVTLESPTTNAQFRTLPARDFPRLEDMSQASAFDLNQRDLKQLITKVLIAVPTRDPRKVLLGALFQVKDGYLSAVATDGKILAHARLPHAIEPAPPDASAIIPHKVLDELRSHLGDDGLVSMNFEEKQVGFRLANITYMANKIDGTYPNFEAVVPKSFSRGLRFPREPMQAALRRAAVLSDTRNNAVTVTFRGEETIVEAEHPDKGRIRETFEARSDGSDFSITFSHSYVSSALQALEADEILLKANSPVLPAILEAEGKPDVFYLIMPIKLTDIRDQEPALARNDDAEEEYAGAEEES